MCEDTSTDINYDFRKDANGKDPDQHSPNLRKYHKFLWRKPLSNGDIFALDDSIPGIYLRHTSNLGNFDMSSDSVIPTFSKWKRMEHIVKELPRNGIEQFVHDAYCIGGMMIFPNNKVHGKPTMNGERGFSRIIGDRMDLTLECIKRYYMGDHSPMNGTISRYEDFLKLFNNFRGYVQFFLLDDMVNIDYYNVKFFNAFNSFITDPYPKEVNEYSAYIENTTSYIKVRSRCMKLCKNQARKL